MSGKRLYRKVIKVAARDSPNVRYALAEIAAGLPPSNRVILPGVITWDEYVKRRETWDPIRQCIGLDGDFYEGAETLLFPPDWLNGAERYAESIRHLPRVVKGIGIDPGEGVADTSMYAVDEMGVVEKVSKPTPNTSVIVGEMSAFIKKHRVDDKRVCIDVGGGGRVHADRIRECGHPGVRMVGFGEAVSPAPRRGVVAVKDRIQQKADRYVFKNRRAEMYGTLRILLDPSNEQRFGIPASMTELRKQLAPIPLTYDDEGRLKLLPKPELVQLIGRSPDEADALVLAVFAMMTVPDQVVVGNFMK